MAKWKATVSEIEFIRTSKYGEPYDATVTFKIIDGEVRAVRLLANPAAPFTRHDLKEIEDELRARGYTEYKRGRYVNGELRVTTKVL